MESIQLWSLDKDSNGKATANPVEIIKELEAERLLEDILSQHPELLLPGLLIIGRQTPTATGWLDLLGVDGDGQLVVFELKRGTLARDAVAQVIDYASYLNTLELKELARHIEERSGNQGVDKIEDFEEWYQQEFPVNSMASLLPPKMVLVGMGVDEPTNRMTRFLVNSDVDISVVTFHGFQQGEQMMLARQVQIESKEEEKTSTNKPNKAARQKDLHDLATQLGVSKRYEDIRDFLNKKFPLAYESPQKTGTSFYLLERTETGTQSYRAYGVIYLQQFGEVHLGFYERTIEFDRSEFDHLRSKYPTLGWKSPEILFNVNSDENWIQLKEKLDPILSKVYLGWQDKAKNIDSD